MTQLHSSAFPTRFAPNQAATIANDILVRLVCAAGALAALPFAIVAMLGFLAIETACDAIAGDEPSRRRA